MTKDEISKLPTPETDRLDAIDAPEYLYVEKCAELEQLLSAAVMALDTLYEVSSYAHRPIEMEEARETLAAIRGDK